MGFYKTKKHGQEVKQPSLLLKVTDDPKSIGIMVYSMELIQVSVISRKEIQSNSSCKLIVI